MEAIVNVVIGFLTAGIVQLLKKIKLPAKYAPVIVLVVAGLIVSIARGLGFTPDLKTVQDALIAALGIGGMTTLAYDQVKKLTEVKK